MQFNNAPVPPAPPPFACSVHFAGCMQFAVQRPCTGEQDPQVRHPRAPGRQGVDSVEPTPGTRRYRGIVRLPLLQTAGAIALVAECRISGNTVLYSRRYCLSRSPLCCCGQTFDLACMQVCIFGLTSTEVSPGKTSPVNVRNAGRGWAGLGCGGGGARSCVGGWRM